MTSWKLKASCLAIASASLMLAGCGEDSNDSGLSVLKYTGSDTEATVDATNYEDVAAQTSAVVLSLAAQNVIGDAAWDGIYSSGPRSAQIADAVKQAEAAVRAASKNGTTTSAPAGIVETSGGSMTSKSSGTFEGECGGVATYSRTMTNGGSYSYETDENATPVDKESNEYGEDSTYSFNNFCFEYSYGEDVTEVVVNGSMNMSFQNSREYDNAADSSVESGGYNGNGSFTVLLAEKTYSVKQVFEQKYYAERAYSEEMEEDLFNPDTYLNKSYGTYLVTGEGVSAKASYENTCHVTEDLTDTDCDENNVISVAGKNYKYDGYVGVDYGTYVYGSLSELFLPQYGSVSVSYNNLTLCEDYKGFASGSISINGGDIVIDYSNGCDVAPTVTQGVVEAPAMD